MFDIPFRSEVRLIVLAFLITCFAGPANGAGPAKFDRQFAPSDTFVMGPEANVRGDICLNGLWQFQPVMLPATFKEGIDPTPQLTAPTSDGWDRVPIRIPSPWNANSFGNRNGQGGDFRNFPSYPAAWEKAEMGWLRRYVSVPAKWQGTRVILHFNAAAGDLQIFVNGKKAGGAFDIFFPISVDISDFVKFGEKNEILIGVRKPSLFDQVDPGVHGRRPYQAGSFWGQHVVGIWQDVDLLSVPTIRVEDVFIQPWVSKDTIEAQVTLHNDTDKDVTADVGADIHRWTSLAPHDGVEAAEPKWKLETATALVMPAQSVVVPAHGTSVTVLRQKVKGSLDLWSPDAPNLYGAVFRLNNGGQSVDIKYQRFGWRQFLLHGSEILLNGKPIVFKGDSWHFLGIPQMSRRYAWAWYSALHAANLNAVRLHAEPYPEFYLDMADEMGIMVLDESAIWASDGGPKLQSRAFWEDTKSHIEHLVLRDRNHASVLGWSVCNEVKPVVRGVFHNPPGVYDTLLQYYAIWAEICRKLDPTRQWISADGDDDGEGRLPVYVVHYGGNGAIQRASQSGKPWGVGEAGGAYYATPKQVAEDYGDQAYVSFGDRMKGIAMSSYQTLVTERKAGADYRSIFNLVWYGLKPLPLGMTDLTKTPTLDDGIFFPDYVEGMPGVQPERLGPYSTTLNPGYDPSLPAYDPWPLFDAIRDASALKQEPLPLVRPPNSDTSASPKAQDVNSVDVLSGGDALRRDLTLAGVPLDRHGNKATPDLLFVDGDRPPPASASPQIEQVLAKGGTVFISEPSAQGLDDLNKLLPFPLTLGDRKTTSLVLGEANVATHGLTLASLYFSEVKPAISVRVGLDGPAVTHGKILLQACNTDWTKWNGQPEYAKTAMVLRSEREAKASGVALVELTAGKGRILITTLPIWSPSHEIDAVSRKILENLGVSLTNEKDAGKPLLPDGELIRVLAVGHFASSSEEFVPGLKGPINHDDKAGNLRWGPIAADGGKFDLSKAPLTAGTNAGTSYLSFWVESPRSLDNLLVEPDIPKVGLELATKDGAEVFLNGSSVYKKNEEIPSGSFDALAFQQGWNHVVIRLTHHGGDEDLSLRLTSSNPAFLLELKSELQRP